MFPRRALTCACVGQHVLTNMMSTVSTAFTCHDSSMWGGVSWHPTHLFFHAPPDHTQVSLRILPAQLHYAHTGASLPRSVCPPLVTLTLHLYILHAVAPLSFYTHHHYKLAPVMVSSSAGRLRYTCRQQTRTGATAVTLDAVTARIHVSRHAFPANAPREPCPAVTPPFRTTRSMRSSVTAMGQRTPNITRQLTCLRPDVYEPPLLSKTSAPRSHHTTACARSAPVYIPSSLLHGPRPDKQPATLLLHLPSVQRATALRGKRHAYAAGWARSTRLRCRFFHTCMIVPPAD